MPTFISVKVEAEVDVDFEVFCSCGEHMCDKSDTRQSRTRGAAQVVVSACPSCIERATTPLNDRIEELEQEIEELQSRMELERNT